ncbi:MAG: entericidin A/B family lipoprotein [Desulfobulbaceae bacterium]|nr:entericidin A/B family lipoprotein [Desulfobulbaceae bacterium]
MKIKKTLATFFSLLLLVAALQGCNTIQGMGEDIEEGGEAVQDAAQ